ncbi:DUF1493 family protein [Salmonella enterica]|uniref:DUF1493 family protein n=1 Tax=Salmonella enterica TaxID=28901 RepID=UPI0009A9D0A9|nr:DUF1493 family protein [Salmonella enterica]EAA9932160.1 DUF1493 family protein [Salmonella enterica subsp. salamae]EBE1550571.1 DUF1493 family protein [Salmonella enterica subsp. enterica]ECI2502211.1 DUF1493 family protein [Salmonella enterica subsp. enterica serovar Enteritidis]EDU6436440.1 DUF1493 family protein [Salmonella enterica subsp. salamae serovar 47:b:e,n,x,z15]EAA9518811.1 DUF1493 family protein [Salmonella enterica]
MNKINAINPYSRPLGSVITFFLEKARFSEKEMAFLTYDTRLFHDLHLFGDTAEDVLEILQREFNVDMSPFQFNKYFPAEFSKDVKYIDKLNTLLFFKLDILASKYFTSIKKKVDEIYGNYHPLTLGMIEMSIMEKKWASPIK